MARNNRIRKPSNLPITASAAIIRKAEYEIPNLARVSLDNFANNKVKDLKLVTKAFKYTFPFYDRVNYRRAFNKIFALIEKDLIRKIPYLGLVKVPFMFMNNPSSGLIQIYLGPAGDEKVGSTDQVSYLILERYLRMITFKAHRSRLPISIDFTMQSYTIPNKHSRYGSWVTPEERQNNTYNVYLIQIRTAAAGTDFGYLLLHYFNEIEKVFITLHRLAHYADSTYREVTTDPVNRR